MSFDVAVILGTRPEAIKLSPVVHALRARGLSVRVISSGQHEDLVGGALASFGLQPDADLRVMRTDQSLSDLTARLIVSLSRELESRRPRLAVVQGDAATTLAGALVCHDLRLPCAHVEAGLRTGNRNAPWPEEMNRCLTDRLCTRHYPPTEWARQNLIREGLDPSGMVVTGQTGVDAALLVAARLPRETPAELRDVLPDDGARVIYCTGHRRESLGGAIRDVVTALHAVVQERRDVRVILPAHPNPAVQRQLRDLASRHERLNIIEPVSYECSIWLMQRADAIVSDSGGIQEEAPSFGVPVLVTREVTERPEGIEAGFLRLVGTRPDSVIHHLQSVLDDADLRRSLKGRPNPFGDGRASERIADDVVTILREPPA
ncbi:MAG: non-hydrolyzing UDP-N-acetylglucosamine 2-epimerase [Candidatus Polarisedimenticolia bacterium]